jgi:predicted secreted protein
MSASAAKSLMIEIAPASLVQPYALLSGVQLRDMRMEQETRTVNAVQADAWNRLSVPVKRSLMLRVQGLVYASVAQASLRQAALSGEVIRARVTMPQTPTLSGQFVVRSYGEAAQADEFLQLEVMLESAGVLAVS